MKPHVGNGTREWNPTSWADPGDGTPYREWTRGEWNPTSWVGPGDGTPRQGRWDGTPRRGDVGESRGWNPTPGGTRGWNRGNNGWRGRSGAPGSPGPRGTPFPSLRGAQSRLRRPDPGYTLRPHRPPTPSPGPSFLGQTGPPGRCQRTKWVSRKGHGHRRRDSCHREPGGLRWVCTHPGAGEGPSFGEVDYSSPRPPAPKWCVGKS